MPHMRSAACCCTDGSTQLSTTQLSSPEPVSHAMKCCCLLARLQAVHLSCCPSAVGLTRPPHAAFHHGCSLEHSRDVMAEPHNLRKQGEVADLTVKPAAALEDGTNTSEKGRVTAASLECIHLSLLQGVMSKSAGTA